MAKKAGKKAVKKQPVKVKAGKPAAPPQPEPESKSPLPSAWWLTKTASMTLWQNRKLFGGITLIYGLLNLILVQGLANSGDIQTLKNNLESGIHGHVGSLATGLGNFVILFGSSGNGSDQTAGAYQLFLALIASMAVVWSLRQVLAGAVFRIRDAYYKSAFPLIPLILVLVVIGLQLLPFVIGAGLYSSVVANNIAVNALERVAFGLIFVGLALGSLYMLTSSLFALYIVMLPDMTPLKALRSAKQLVHKRRWTVLRKILWLPLVLVVVAGVIMLPIIVWLTPVTQWIFFILTMSALVAIHAYMYTLYRELLSE